MLHISERAHVSTERYSSIPCMSPSYPEPQKVTSKGLLWTLGAALTIFGIALLSTRTLLRTNSPGVRDLGETSSAELKRVVSDGRLEMGDAGLSGTHVSLLECTGNRSLPVLEGVDVVAYHQLDPGADPVYGHSSIRAYLNNYVFYFSTEENKQAFQNNPWKYAPAWGGFCSWGIAAEEWWSKKFLGPPADPARWMTRSGILHVFHSSVPMKEYTDDMYGNKVAGDNRWASWWGKLTGSPIQPFNTGCFCSVETCLDL